jgi:hypothetical protein
VFSAGTVVLRSTLEQAGVSVSEEHGAQVACHAGRYVGRHRSPLLSGAFSPPLATV